jgi:NADH-quinone oxidoreductase subunit G
MEHADFVVALTAFQSEALNRYADVLLPIAAFAETSGTYINNEGRVQCFHGAVPPQGEARPAWQVLRLLAHRFNVDGFDYESSAAVYDEAINAIGKIKGDNTDRWQTTVSAGPKGQGLQRISETPMNMIDSLTRRAASLQQTNDIADGAIHINFALASKHKLTHTDDATVEQDKQQVTMKVIIDERIPDNCVLIQSARPGQTELGGAFGSIKIRKR